MAAFWQTVEKHEAGTPDRCPACGSFHVVEDYRPDLESIPLTLNSANDVNGLHPQRFRRMPLRSRTRPTDLQNACGEPAADRTRQKRLSHRFFPSAQKKFRLQPKTLFTRVMTNRA